VRSNDFSKDIRTVNIRATRNALKFVSIFMKNVTELLFHARNILVVF